MIHLPAPAQFSWTECLWFLDRRYDDCLYAIEGQSVTKAVVLEGRPVLLRISGDREGLKVDVKGGKSASEETIQAYIRDWFDMDRDVRPFYSLLRKHPRVAYMAREFKGLRLVGIPDLFESLSWCIIGQQINLSFAHKVKRQLVAAYGGSVAGHSLFPAPEVLAELKEPDYKALQFSRLKAEYMITLSKAFADGVISKVALLALEDTEARMKALTSIRGIGAWTANYALMKSLRDTTRIPHGDVGLLKALVDHDLMADRKDQKAFLRFFAEFSGWESYMVFYLWRSLSPPQLAAS